MWIIFLFFWGGGGADRNTIFYIILAPSELFKCKCTLLNANVLRSKVTTWAMQFLAGQKPQLYMWR